MAVVEDRTVGAPAPLQTDARPKRGRHRGRWILAIVLVVGLATGSFLLWAAHYQPIEFGGLSMQWPGELTPEPGQPMTQLAADQLEYNSKFIVYAKHKGDRFGFEYGLYNTGPYGVTVLGLDKSTTDRFAPLFDVQAGFDPYRGTRTPQSPAFVWSTTPRSLPKGAIDMNVGATYTYVGCPKGLTAYQDHGAGGFSSVGVRYRFLWFTHTAEIPMTDALWLVHGPRCH